MVFYYPIKQELGASAMSRTLHENHTELQLDRTIITHEKCQKCPDIFYADELAPDYKGAVATYGHDSYCTMTCFSSQQTNQD